MWWWDGRGKEVWERELGSLQAANFGAQGTHPGSLVWRMQNGELDGYQAKLVVLSVSERANEPLPSGSRFTDWVSGYAAVVAEIRARQPQAKILLFAALPRGGTLREWRELAAANAAAFAGLVDDQTVFYADIGERFYLPDGSFNGATWSRNFGSRGTQPSAYELWAEELQPWLDQFVR
jgi:beta-glucosidase